MKKISQENTIRFLIIVVVILAAVIIAPYFHQKSAPLPSSSMTDMTNPEMPGMVMASYPLDAADTDTTVPTVHAVITKDEHDGWNLHILTTNFTFTPELEDQAPAPNAGHAHLYIDGVLSVVYGPWYHFNDLSPGAHTITVSLNANDHSIFTYKGVKVQDVEQIQQP